MPHRKSTARDAIAAQLQDYVERIPGGLLANSYDMSDLVFEFVSTGGGKTSPLFAGTANRRHVEPFSREAPRFLNVREIEALIGKSKATIYRWIRQGRFPEPRVSGQGSTLWHSDQFLDWSDAKHNGKK